MTKVVNLNKEPYDVYIGRAGKGLDGYFGNPHPVWQEGKPWTFCKLCQRKHVRGEAIEAYAKDFYNRIEKDIAFKNRILELKDKVLGCFCRPKYACHGDIIADYLDKLIIKD